MSVNDLGCISPASHLLMRFLQLFLLLQSLFQSPMCFFDFFSKSLSFSQSLLSKELKIFLSLPTSFLPFFLQLCLICFSLQLYFFILLSQFHNALHDLLPRRPFLCWVSVSVHNDDLCLSFSCFVEVESGSSFTVPHGGRQCSGPKKGVK